MFNKKDKGRRVPVNVIHDEEKAHDIAHKPQPSGASVMARSTNESKGGLEEATRAEMKRREALPISIVRQELKENDKVVSKKVIISVDGGYPRLELSIDQFEEMVVEALKEFDNDHVMHILWQVHQDAHDEADQEKHDHIHAIASMFAGKMGLKIDEE